MTIQELGEKFCLPVEKLKKYESCGLLPGRGNEDGTREYSDDDIRILGLICILTESGMSCGEIKKYLSLPENGQGDRERILMLKARRGELLQEIHQKQKLLDKIDFLIREKKQIQEERNYGV